ncbi:MAG: helix-turn-helix domain-containing protein [Actinobacteria bacterium]|nr:helix-turn-helix domain-containing protein [Actinomycetota bacterium]
MSFASACGTAAPRSINAPPLLTGRQFALLRSLAARPGKTVSNSEMVDASLGRSRDSRRSVTTLAVLSARPAGCPAARGGDPDYPPGGG